MGVTTYRNNTSSPMTISWNSSPRMIPSNPLRLPRFKEEKPMSEQILPVSLLSRPPPLKMMREVKRNAFPTSHLKLKTITKPTTKSASSRSCSVQMFELMRRACGLISSRIPRLHPFGTLRRSRSERKRDWEMVKILLKDAHATPPSFDKLRETPGAIQAPVVERILLPADCQPKYSMNALPAMLLIPPQKKMSALSIESNMCFEVEILKSICGEISSPQTQSHTRESTHYANILSTLQQSTSKKLIDPCSLEMRVESPVMKSAALKSSTITSLNPELLESILRPALTDTTASMLESRGIVNQDLCIAKFKSMENYKVSLREAVGQTLRNFKTSSAGPQVARNSWPQVIVDGHVLKEDDLKESFHVAINMTTPILLRRILVSDSKNGEEKLLWKAPVPETRSTRICTNALFQSLSGFQRHLFTSEKSFWCRASKEVLSRGKYKRRRLLSAQHQVSSQILSLKQYSAKSTTASMVEPIYEALDNLIFSRLRVLFVPYHEGRDRATALLDGLDFVPEQVANVRQKFFTKCHQRVREMQHKYDSPTRKWGQVHFKKIVSRYENMRQSSLERNESYVHKNVHSADDDADSDESMLDDFVISDEELEGQNIRTNGLGILEEIHEDLRRFKTTGTHNAEVHRKEYGDLQGPSAGTHKTLKVRLKVPDALVCAPWVIQVAEQCVKKLPKVSIFLPPPLSVLPITAILTSTHLRDSIRDQRVVVVCESQTDVTNYIREYLQSSLGQSVSIDSIKRSECEGVESIAPLPHTAARVVVLDSFCFSFSVSFSLLIVFVTGEATSADHVRSRDQIFNIDGSQWLRIPFVLLTSLGAWAGLQTYCTAARQISKQLRVQDVLWVTSKDDVYDLIEMSSPRVVCLAPSQQATDVANLLEAQAAPHLQIYRGLKKYTTRTCKTIKLKDVNLRLVRETLQEKLEGDTSGQSQRLEFLYTCRQARTFAIYDGFGVAIDYLLHCSKQSRGQIRRLVNTVLDNIEDEVTPNTHPVAKVLTKCLIEAEGRMLQDPPTLRSIHRRDSFRPLIVTNSQETATGCLQGLKDAVILNEATKRTKAVCSLQQLNAEAKISSRGKLGRNLEDFSHIFHIVDDRYDVPSDLLLPPVLLQHVHAGRTRLITIAVDETRELDDRWEREVSCYDEISRKLDKAEFGNNECGVPYLQQLSSDSFWAVAKSTFPDWEELKTGATQSSVRKGPNMSVNHQNGFSKQKPGTLVVSSHAICSSTVEGLREMLNKHAEALPNECRVLRVFVHIRPSESCTPAATYIHSALAGNERLQKTVIVHTDFTF